MLPPPPTSTLFPYTTLFRSYVQSLVDAGRLTAEEANHHPRKSVILRRSEEHTSELQSLRHLVCRLLLEKKKKQAVSSRRPLAEHNTDDGARRRCPQPGQDRG